MTIAFLGNFAVDYSSENHHAKSLEALGHEVIRLQENQPITETPDCDMFVWVHTHGWYSPGVEQLIKKYKGNVPIVSYHLDLWFGLQRQTDLETDPFYKLIDHWFVTDKLMADWLNANTKVKGYYLPAGVYDQECRMAEGDKSIDVVFVGSRGYHPEWPYRPKLIDWLDNNYRVFRHVGGDGKHLRTTRGQDLNRLYANSKVTVGDSLCINFDYPYYWSDRVYETTGRGGFLIMPYIKGLEDNFELGKEIVTYEFNNFDDLKQKIDYYLDHDNEREEIRKAGHERTKRDHTYKQRWSKILEIVGLA